MTRAALAAAVIVVMGQTACHEAAVGIPEHDAGAPICSDAAPDPIPFSAEGPSIEELCPAVADALCGQWARCGCAPAAGTLDPAACRASVLDECERFVRAPGVEGALATGALDWNGAAAAAFLASLELATRGCDPVSLDLSRAALGHAAHGQPCDDIAGPFSECAEGASCHASPGFLPGHCRFEYVTSAFQPRGGACNPYARCAGWLTCVQTCESELGVCGDGALPGERCSSDRDCASHLCLIGPADAEGTCAEPHVLSDGEPCLASSQCAAGSACLPSDVGSYVCGAPLPIRASCVANDECASGYCTAGAVCAPGAPAFCEEDELCSYFLCERRPTTVGWCDSRPVHPGVPGAVCTSGHDCYSGTCGIDGRCTGGERTVDVCIGTADCTSEICVPDACTQPACTAIIDPTGYGSFWLHPPVFSP